MGMAGRLSAPAPRLAASLRLRGGAKKAAGGFQTRAAPIPAGSPRAGLTRQSSPGRAAARARPQAAASSTSLWKATAVISGGARRR